MTKRFKKVVKSNVWYLAFFISLLFIVVALMAILFFVEEKGWIIFFTASIMFFLFIAFFAMMDYLESRNVYYEEIK